MLHHSFGTLPVSVVRSGNHTSAKSRKTARHTPIRERLENRSISRECVVTVAVLTEPVSAAKFPVLREFTGNIAIFGLIMMIHSSESRAFPWLS
jgi:hypothetical protein